MLENLKQFVITESGEEAWNTLVQDYLEELMIYSFTGDSSFLANRLKDNLEDTGIGLTEIYTIENNPPEERPIAATSEQTYQFSGRFNCRKDEWASFHKSYGPTYHVFNQKYGKNAEPTYNHEMVSGFMIPGNYSELSLTMKEMRYSAKIKDVTYTFHVVRGANIFKVGDYVSPESDGTNYKFSLKTYSFTFNFEEGDMLMIACKNDHTNSYTYVNTALKFT